jgi:phospholipase/carboxylesterase
LTADPHRDQDRSQPLLRSGAPLDEADGAIVLLHGRGGSAEDIISLGDDLGGQRFAYLAPQAANHTWYPYSFLAPIEQNEPFLSSALDRVESIVQLAMAAGILADKVVIAGFSQGACLATEFVARRPRRYAGLIAFTGGLIGPPGSDLTHSGDLEGTPAFFGSGDPDPHVPWARVQQSADVLSRMNADVAVHRYPGMAHTVTREEIESARHHVGTLLPQGRVRKAHSR